MTKRRSALLGACLVLPFALLAGPAGAAQPDGGHYVYVPAGAMVIMLPVPAPARTMAEPADFPVIGMFAQQNRIMRHMMADMDTLMAAPLPDPGQIIRSVMQGVPQAVPGSGVVMTSISSGDGNMCSETITYGYPAGGQPRVKVTRT